MKTLKMSKLVLFFRLVTFYILTIIVQFSVEATEGNIKSTVLDNPVSFTDKDMKVLVLIISSDDQPVYAECEKIWRAYMHLDTDHVEAYFYKANPDLDVECEIQGDIIWSKCPTSSVPGAMQKTLLSMEYMLPRIHEFDYVIKVTVTSFFCFPRLFDFLETLPKTGCISSVIMNQREIFPSGANLMFSPDFVEFLVENKEVLWDVFHYDDIVLGRFFGENDIPIIPAERLDIPTIDSWSELKDNIPDNIFHFRVKNPDHRLRVTEDLYIHKELLKRFYDICLKDS